MFIPNYGINSQQPGGVSAPVISGFAYPGETLASTSAGQWYVDGVVVTGETGTTFAPTIYDIGLDIHQVNGSGASNVLTCWHPRDVSQVKSCRVPWAGVLNAVGPDTPATVGQTVRRWTDIVNGWTADQTTGANQPILREANGIRYLESDGANDVMIMSGAELGTFQNVAYGALIIAVCDRNPNGGSASHRAIFFSAGVTVVARSSLVFRNPSPGGFGVRRLDGDSFANAAFSSNSGYGVYSGLYKPALGTFHSFRNGVAENSNNFSSGSGNSSNTPSVIAEMFGESGIVNNFLESESFCFIACSGSTDLSAADFSRLQRFAMLCMGANYSGPDIPLVAP